MTKLLLEIELGNEAMQSMGDVLDTIHASFEQLPREHHLRPQIPPTSWPLRDVNGNVVGQWSVVK